VQNVKGGIYRIRAWRPPDLAMTTPVVFYLNGNEQKTGVNLQVNHYTGTNVTAAVAPNPPVVGDPTNLAVQVTAVVVDAGGVVRATPQVGVEVDLQGAGGAWQTQAPIAATTDVNGEAFWRVTCTATGSQPLAAAVGGTSYPLNLPPCQLASDVTNSTSTTSFSRSTTTR